MQMIAGMAIAASVVGAKTGYIYIRFEYRDLVPALEKTVEEFKALVPRHKDFDCRIIVGAGPYICGEETALFESIEGKHPQTYPDRSQFPTTRGLYGKPTLIHNVESLVTAAGALAMGGAKWGAVCPPGTQKGVKVFSISGDVEKPILAELPLGITIKQMLDMVGLKDIAAVEIAGILSPILFEEDFDLVMGYEPGDLSPVGSVVVFKKSSVAYREQLYDIYENKFVFCRDEACGLCTPCKEGTRYMVDILPQLWSGDISASDDAVMAVADCAAIGSNCGHGKAFGQLCQETLEQLQAKQI